MDFGALPPEINSARMYAGPGPGTMLTAATAWDQLATELQLASAHYRSVVSELTSAPWQGTSSVSMAAAAAPQIGWLTTTGAQAEETAGQARAAVSAYESAFAMTVPPPVIAANRAQLMSLVATNFLGQNTPAIAVTEAHYAQMWAQDAAAMYGYAGASAAAATLSPFTGPPQTINPGALASQAAAVGTSVGTDVVGALPQMLSTVPTVLEALASPLLLSENPLLALDLLLGMTTVMAASTSMASSLTGMVGAVAAPAELIGAGEALGGPALASGFAGGAPILVNAGGAGVLADVGRGSSLGALSVPQTWAANAAPAAFTPLPGGGPESATTLEAGAPGSLLGGLPLAMPARGGRSGLRKEQGRSVIPRTRCAG